MHKGVFVRGALVCAVALTLTACGRFGEGNTRPEVTSLPNSAEDSEAALQNTVEAYVSAVNQRSSGAGSEVVRVKPYYFKEYATYPEGAADARIEFVETDSLTTPRLAEVTVEKQRFATRMYRDRDDASVDNTFYRGTGEETITFAYRNGRWEKTGSLFVAERLEENINGEWVPVREEVERALSVEDEEEGWFRRAISTITGRY